jgi:manganese oxidase
MGAARPPPLTSPFEPDTGPPRRGFLAAGAGAFLCTIGGERVLLSKPGDAAKADAAARRVAAPRARAAAAGAPGAGPTEQLTFTTPQPQPGGTAREY